MRISVIQIEGNIECCKKKKSQAFLNVQLLKMLQILYPATHTYTHQKTFQFCKVHFKENVVCTFTEENTEFY